MAQTQTERVAPSFGSDEPSTRMTRMPFVRRAIRTAPLPRSLQPLGLKVYYDSDLGSFVWFQENPLQGLRV